MIQNGKNKPHTLDVNGSHTSAHPVLAFGSLQAAFHSNESILSMKLLLVYTKIVLITLPETV
ncbi:hypothetical protein [Metabacillus litoralis]|uniref:hypothetical protein n=1 Tax=Metabacillus litoralis TaxID=152268 RepID=UPI00203C8420|nr:hypothetical protein [Metabacillus litoralis]